MPRAASPLVEGDWLSTVKHKSRGGIYLRCPCHAICKAKTGIQPLCKVQPFFLGLAAGISWRGWTQNLCRGCKSLRVSWAFFSTVQNQDIKKLHVSKW